MQISEFLWNKFKKARSKCLPIHDRDLRRWARKKAKELNLDFKASQKYIYHFKQKFRISGRKVEKYTSNKHIVAKNQLELNAELFRSSVKQEFSNFNPDYILNSDQIGFAYESVLKRTLTFKNEKHTLLSIQSKNATTHSFTIQPTITLSGHCYGKLFICLKESSNNFGTIVKAQIDKLLKTVKNVIVVSSRCGKMNNFLVNLWSQSLSIPVSHFDEKINLLLLLDSYSAHWNENFVNSYNKYKINIERRKIPPGTTAEAQALDKYFNHDLKFFVKRFTERINVDEIDIDLKNRLVIIQLFSLLWDQLCSNKFNDMIRYSWASAEYLNENVKF